MTENYEGWSIVTDRENGLMDVVTRKFTYGKYSSITAFIESDASEKEYYLKICSSDPFHFGKTIPLKSKDYHSLCNEGNDVLRGLFTEAHEYIIQFIKELPEI